MLVLDEPTVGLDLASRNAILRWLRDAKARGTTILMASHVPEDIVAIADRIAIVDNGRIASLVAAPEFLDVVHRRREAS